MLSLQRKVKSNLTTFWLPWTFRKISTKCVNKNRLAGESEDQSTLTVWAVHDSCFAQLLLLTCVWVHMGSTSAAVCLRQWSIQIRMKTWFSFNLLKERKKEKDSTPGRDCLSLVVCIFFMSVTYYTDKDIKTVVKHCYDVNMTVHISFSGLFLLRVTWEN